jgi:ABC-type Fe3+-hydroxamate transport system substrate-binding protein
VLSRRPTVLIVLVLAAGLLGCGGGSRNPATGAPAAPQRIVSLSPALTEVLFALGVGARVVGVTEYCTYPPEARTRPKVGGYANPSVEAVLALKPDLVVVSPGPGNRDAALGIERAGVRVAVVPAETLDDSYAAIGALARECGVEQAGRDLVDRVHRKIDAVVARVGSLRRVPALFVVQFDPIIAAGRGTLPSQLLELAGGANVVDAPRYPRLGIESVAAAKPEVILQSRMDAAGSDGRAEAAAWKRWSWIPAVAADRVVVLPDDLALRPGPRVADAVEELAAIVHPEAAAGAR